MRTRSATPIARREHRLHVHEATRRRAGEGRLRSHAQLMVESDVLWPDLRDRVARDLRHRAADLTAIDVERTLGTHFSSCGGTVKRAASDEHHFRAERERFDDVASTTHTAVEEHGRAIANGFYDLRQHLY